MLTGMYVSIPWTSPFEGMDGAVQRGSDWGIRGWRRVPHYLRESWRVHRAAGDLLVMTAGMEVFFLSLFSLFSRRTLVVYDFLRPQTHWAVPLGRVLLRRVDRWLVIRSSDTAVLADLFRVPARRCEFVPFPGRASDVDPTLGGYVYAAGIAHRDWPTLLAAARMSGVPFIVSAEPRLADVPSNVDSRALVPPDEGRRLAAGARLVVVPLHDTTLPSGPLVVVDSQATGKAVIASDVGGTRDYVEHRRTGWLVAPGDAGVLADAISDVFEDVATLERVGRTAAHAVLGPAACFARARRAAQPDER